MATSDNLAYLNRFVAKSSLEVFYPDKSLTLQNIASRADTLIGKVHPQFVNTREMARSLSILALYDMVLLLDDSGSMRLEEGGRRIEALQAFVTRIADVATHFDTDGIAIRWINGGKGLDHIKNAGDVADIVSDHAFGGSTKLGTKLWDRVLWPLVVEPARRKKLEKPVLVMIITDGEPNKEPVSQLKRSILKAQSELRECGYGKPALAVQIARVGNSSQAKRFIHLLDVDPEIGDVVDCIHEEGIERAQELLESGGTSEADIWLTRLLTGAVNRYYDQIND